MNQTVWIRKPTVEVGLFRVKRIILLDGSISSFGINCYFYEVAGFICMPGNFAACLVRLDLCQTAPLHTQ